MRTLIVSAVFSILGMVAASQAQDIGDVQQGRQLALDVCASCHAVRAGQTQSPLATAPSFEEIAHMPGMTAAALAFWLTARITSDHAEPHSLAATGSQCVDLPSEPPGLAPGASGRHGFIPVAAASGSSTAASDRPQDDDRGCLAMSVVGTNPTSRVTPATSAYWGELGSGRQSVKSALLTHFGLQPYRHIRADHFAFAIPNVVSAARSHAFRSAKPSL